MRLHHHTEEHLPLHIIACLLRATVRITLTEQLFDQSWTKHDFIVHCMGYGMPLGI